MESKARQIDLNEVKDTLKQLPTLDQIKLLQSSMRTTLDSHKKERDEFASEFSNHVDIIGRYDEILSQKASKHSVYDVENKMKQYLKPVTKELKGETERNLSLIQE